MWWLIGLPAAYLAIGNLAAAFIHTYAFRLARDDWLWLVFCWPYVFFVDPLEKL